jgi:hypothetical protein
MIDVFTHRAQCREDRRPEVIARVMLFDRIAGHVDPPKATLA